MEIFFIKNKNSSKSIYDFLYVQQNYNEIILTTNLTCGVDYESYISKYLILIEYSDDDKYDMLTNKNSKFLF